MNERLQEILNNIKDRYAAMSSQSRLGIGIGLAVLAVSAIAAVLVLKEDPYTVLYSDLQNEDSRAITKKLGEKNVPYQALDDGRTVLVPKSQVANARMQLAKDGLPGNDVVGFEKFDNSTLGMSSYVQRIQYVRAVQGELTRSIQRLSAVKSARVHISVPPKKTFLEEEDPPKASVVLELKLGQQPSKSEIQGVAHLVASAVEGLKVNQVTIVDTKGTFLHRPEDAGTAGMSGALLELQRSIETEYERRVEDILTPVIGFGKVRAKITAEIDPSRVNTTEESYDPEKATPRTIVKNEENTNGQRPNPVGIPGSRSNLPGAEAQNPSVPMATQNSEKNTSNSTYAIPRKIQVVDKPSGNIKRLTVAVVVDGTYQKNTTGTGETFQPRSEDELKRLQELVANAVGFDSQRRDSITVSSLPFRTSDLAPTEEPAPAKWWQREEVTRQLLRNGLIATLMLAFFFLVLRPVLRWTFKSEEAEKLAAAEEEKQKEIESAIAMMPRTVAELEAAKTAADPLGVLSAASGGEQGSGQDPEPSEKIEEEELRKKVLERLDRTPKKGLRIIQEWLEEEKVAIGLPKAA